MKQIIKQTVAVLLVIALAFGVGQTIHNTSAQASSKELTKADFKFKGIYKSGMNAVIKTESGMWHMFIADDVGEDNPVKCVKTKRGITLTSTKEQVFKKYGKVSLQKINKKSTFYQRILTANLPAERLKLIKKEKYASYSYSDSKINSISLYFFFNKENKVNSVIVYKDA